MLFVEMGNASKYLRVYLVDVSTDTELRLRREIRRLKASCWNIVQWLLVPPFYHS